MKPIPFVTLDQPSYGRPLDVSPLIRRVIAENPSKFTYHGTGTYIVGHGDVAVIDPGPLLDSHRDALAAALDGERVRAILVTHCHADHSPLAAWLREVTGAPTVAFGPHVRADAEERDEDIDDDADDDRAEVKIEESTDYAFDPDARVADGEIAALGPGWTLRAVHTPGHTSNHLCFALDEEHALFTGDHIMGWSTTVISPPDGDMRAYLSSLHAVRRRSDAVLWPTHGAPVPDPGPFIDAYIAHRLEREAQVLAAVRAGTAQIKPMVKQLYANVDTKLHKPAARSVLAHLVKLVDDGLVVADGAIGLKATFYPA